MAAVWIQERVALPLTRGRHTAFPLPFKKSSLSSRPFLLPQFITTVSNFRWVAGFLGKRMSSKWMNLFINEIVSLCHFFILFCEPFYPCVLVKHRRLWRMRVMGHSLPSGFTSECVCHCVVLNMTFFSLYMVLQVFLVVVGSMWGV